MCRYYLELGVDIGLCARSFRKVCGDIIKVLYFVESGWMCAKSWYPDLPRYKQLASSHRYKWVLYFSHCLSNERRLRQCQSAYQGCWAAKTSWIVEGESACLALLPTSQARKEEIKIGTNVTAIAVTNARFHQFVPNTAWLADCLKYHKVSHKTRHHLECQCLLHGWWIREWLRWGDNWAISILRRAHPPIALMVQGVPELVVAWMLSYCLASRWEQRQMLTMPETYCVVPWVVCQSKIENSDSFIQRLHDGMFLAAVVVRRRNPGWIIRYCKFKGWMLNVEIGDVRSCIANKWSLGSIGIVPCRNSSAATVHVDW